MPINDTPRDTAGNTPYVKTPGEWYDLPTSILTGGLVNPALIREMTSGNISRQAPGGIFNNLDPNYRFPSGTNVDPYWEQKAKGMLNAPPRSNPYNNATADQSRGAQMALYQQMQAQRAGPSIAAIQGGGAQGANLQAALAARGGGAVNRMAAQGAGGLGSDVGQAVLAEQMRSQQGLGGLATGLRGRDLQSAQNQGQAALQARSLDDAARQFYAQQGSQMNAAALRQQLENAKLLRRGSKQTDKDLLAEVEMGFNAIKAAAGGG
jgi:hypothetical protein